MQNSVGHPRYADLVSLCIGDPPGPGIQSSSSGFHLLWVQELRPSPFMSFRKVMQNSAEHPWYAYLVPLCIREGPDLVLEFRAQDFFSFKFPILGLVFLLVSWKLMQNSVGTPSIWWPCATLYQRLYWSWDSELRISSFKSSRAQA